MSHGPIVQSELDPQGNAADLCAGLRKAGRPSLFLDGSGGFERAWEPGSLVAVDPEIVLEWCPTDDLGPDAALARIDAAIRERRARGGTAETGIAVLLAYDLFAPRRRSVDRDGLPEIVALSVDRSVSFSARDRALLTVRDGIDPPRVRDRLESLAPTGDNPSARIDGVPMTSLPRKRYLDALDGVFRHIRRGDIYQANLCQRFQVGYRGDPCSLYRELAAANPAPLSAFVDTGTIAVASVSPETFVRVSRQGLATTWPIKGTRPRGATKSEDRAAAAELSASIKDRAELVMIVDLERNDLSRICLPGTVQVPELVSLTSYATVHHLIACVEGQLRDEVGLVELIQAMFPGGSITGAPKVRAMEILRELEPVSRNCFTGSLLWFADDGSLDSSILIRTMVFDRKTAYLGAGGGIVADSDPEQEWLESNHKARPLAQILGFDPLEAV